MTIAQRPEGDRPGQLKGYRPGVYKAKKIVAEKSVQGKMFYEVWWQVSREGTRGRLCF